MQTGRWDGRNRASSKVRAVAVSRLTKAIPTRSLRSVIAGSVAIGSPGGNGSDSPCGSMGAYFVAPVQFFHGWGW
jgi:hypothetical protein